MTAADLHQQITQASMSLNRCACGSKAVMHYEPGCTYIRCLAERETKLSLPDWQPNELATLWNQQNPKTP